MFYGLGLLATAAVANLVDGGSTTVNVSNPAPIVGKEVPMGIQMTYEQYAKLQITMQLIASDKNFRQKLFGLTHQGCNRLEYGGEISSQELESLFKKLGL